MAIGGSPVPSSIRVIVCGLAAVGFLFLGAVPLFIAEQGAIDDERGLASGARAVKPGNLDRVDPALNKHLVHVVGPLACEGPPVVDEELGITRDAVRLNRRVSMLQWEQYQVKRDKVFEVAYRQVWSEHVIDSEKFQEIAGHTNPKKMEFVARQASRAKVSLGVYRVPHGLTSQLPMLRHVPPAEAIKRLPAGLPDRIVPHPEYLNLRQDPKRDSIGDLRIWWEEALPGDVTVLAAQIGDTFGPFPTGAGQPLMALRSGRMPPDALLGSLAEEKASNLMLWRVGAAFLFVIGLAFASNAYQGDVQSRPVWCAGVLLYGGIMGTAWLLKGRWTGLVLLAAVGALAVVGMQRLRTGAAERMPPSPPPAAPRPSTRKPVVPRSKV